LINYRGALREKPPNTYFNLR